VGLKKKLEQISNAVASYLTPITSLFAVESDEGHSKAD
jgi:hypothetical protein